MRNPRKPGLVAHWPGLAVGADLQHHQPRVDLAERIKAQPPFLHRAGAEILKHHVRLRHQLPEQVGPLGRAQIERDRLLVPRLAEPDQGVASLGHGPEPA